MHKAPIARLTAFAEIITKKRPRLKVHELYNPQEQAKNCLLCEVVCTEMNAEHFPILTYNFIRGSHCI